MLTGNNSIEDSQTAYRWIIGHGPRGESNAGKLAIAGDSAGGNLSLMLAAWARDEKVRPADCIIAFAPATDAGLESPSLRRNAATDPILGPVVGMVAKLPAAILFYMNWWLLKLLPTNQRLSPLRGDLGRLPPTLMQVSSTEMLYDDAVRYFHKARSAGADIYFQHWTDRVHVFQAFGSDIPEADEALSLAADFLRTALGTVKGMAGAGGSSR